MVLGYKFPSCLISLLYQLLTAGVLVLLITINQVTERGNQMATRQLILALDSAILKCASQTSQTSIYLIYHSI